MKNSAECLETYFERTDKNGDINVPGSVYLCQVNESVSCGACCGLYNLATLSREALVNTLGIRTFEFAGVPREASEIIRSGEMVCSEIYNDKPFPEFYHCPYVGLIGNEFSRVDCLLHPMLALTLQVITIFFKSSDRNFVTLTLFRRQRPY